MNVGDGDFRAPPAGAESTCSRPSPEAFYAAAVAPFKTSANQEIGRNTGRRDSVTPATEQKNESFKNSSIRSRETNKHIISR